MDKDKIRQYGIELGADVVGFAAIEDYKSKQSPDPTSILPGVKSLVVMGYRELDGSTDSPNMRVCMGTRMGIMELSLKNNYLMGKHIEDLYNVKIAPVPVSYPLDMGPGIYGFIGDVCVRHAAVAAGLGVFGRHNLVINPQLGTRIIFTAILTESPVSSDPPVKDELCDQCGLCVEACPAGALDVEGQTDQLKCLKSSQPYGIGGLIRYIRKFIDASPQEQKELLKDPVFLSLYQAGFIGFQYVCNKCLAVCPACLSS